jgi:organic hydroperoxide reductase OsmC/OhrA
MDAHKRQGDAKLTAVRHKEFRFPVEIRWDGGRRTTAKVDGKVPLRIATPPVFRGSDPELWSPEDAFVASAASCLAVTIAALAERDDMALYGLSVRGDGIVGRRSDGRFGFVRLEQTVVLEVDAEDEMAARALVAKAEDGCLVTVSLDLPVETTVAIRPRVPFG